MSMETTKDEAGELAKNYVYRSDKEILGAFAMWIVRQSPFIEDISPILKDIQGECDKFGEHGVQKFYGNGRLKEWVRAICHGMPSVTQLNISKAAQKGEETPEIMFTSRYDSPKPEYDFVDLDALERNVFNQLLESE